MARTITLVINNCKECPHHIVASARVTEEQALQINIDVASGKVSDPFKKYPLSVFCSKTRTDELPSREVVTFTPPVKPEKLKAMCEMPKWCPLLNK